MLETIAMLGIVSRDSILYDENLEIKMKSINRAYEVVDEIAEYGDAIKSNPDFIERAKKAYNELLCVLSDVRIADEFQTIALENKNPYNIARIAQFKLMCRKDIGLKTSKSKAVERALKERETQQMSQPQYAQPQFAQPTTQPLVQPQMVQTQPAQPTAPVQPVAPAQPTAQAIPQRPTAPRPVQPGRPAVRPTAPRPVGRPTTAGKPTNNGNA